MITGGGNGRCIAEFVVKSENLNGGGTLHGGFTATVVDNYTTYALMTLDKPPGVSVDLHVRFDRHFFLLFFILSSVLILFGYFSYLKGAKEGETIVIDAKTIKAGRTLAYLECELRNKKDDSILARGLQTKFIGH